jgi:hypothetical protein
MNRNLWMQPRNRKLGKVYGLRLYEDQRQYLRFISDESRRTLADKIRLIIDEYRTLDGKTRGIL